MYNWFVVTVFSKTSWYYCSCEGTEIILNYLLPLALVISHECNLVNCLWLCCSHHSILFYFIYGGESTTVNIRFWCIFKSGYESLNGPLTIFAIRCICKTIDYCVFNEYWFSLDVGFIRLLVFWVSISAKGIALILSWLIVFGGWTSIILNWWLLLSSVSIFSSGGLRWSVVINSRHFCHGIWLVILLALNRAMATVLAGITLVRTLIWVVVWHIFGWISINLNKNKI